MKIYYYILIAASILSLLINRKRLDRRLLLFLPLQLASLSTELAHDLLGESHWLYNFLFTVYTPIEYLLQCMVVISFLYSKKQKRIIRYSIPVFIIIALAIQILLKPHSVFYEYLDVLIESPPLCLWTLFLFFQLANEEDNTSYKHIPMFWILAGNLLFFSVSAFGYGFGKYLKYVNQEAYSDELIKIVHIFNMVQYLFFVIAFTIPNWKKTS